MAVPTRDLAILRDQALKVIGFASRTIVHLDQRGWEEGLTFGDLTQAIDIIGELHARYYLLMTGKAKAMLTPAIAGDWRAPFRQALTGLVDEDDDRLDY